MKRRRRRVGRGGVEFVRLYHTRGNVFDASPMEFFRFSRGL